METNNNKTIEKDELTGDKLLSGHEYDGITELDNRLPRWWLWLFIISIVWAVVYLFTFDVFKIFPHQEQEFRNEMQAAANLTPDQSAFFDTNQVALTDQASIDAGKAVFQKQCVACHLAEGQGKIGPNLCDSFSIHGCGFKDVLKTITIGVPEKGMISWKTQLSKDEIVKVASYILTLKGTNPPNPKEPQGAPCK
jgi:cytochrome c oxidase cbb3-type subunit III